MREGLGKADSSSQPGNERAKKGHGVLPPGKCERDGEKGRPANTPEYMNPLMQRNTNDEANARGDICVRNFSGLFRTLPISLSFSLSFYLSLSPSLPLYLG